MRQRVSLIRTLALNPKLLLLDEPFSALDYQTRLSVQTDIHSIIKSEHKTAILVTHDISEAISMSDRIIVLTKRPGTIKNIVELNFPKEQTPLERRNNPAFNGYFKIFVSNSVNCSKIQKNRIIQPKKIKEKAIFTQKYLKKNLWSPYILLLKSGNKLPYYIKGFSAFLETPCRRMTAAN